MAGIKVKMRDPADETQVIYAEFATARSHPELKEVLRKIAVADTRESIASKKAQLINDRMEAAETADEVEAAGAELEEAVRQVGDASMALFDAIREFLCQGYKLAGANDELVEKLVSATDVEHLPQLKAKCLFGEGALDFTPPEGRK